MRKKTGINTYPLAVRLNKLDIARLDKLVKRLERYGPTNRNRLIVDAVKNMLLAHGA